MSVGKLAALSIMHRCLIYWEFLNSIHTFHTYSMFENFWLCSAARRVIVPHPGMEPMLPALEPWSLNHWTASSVQLLSRVWLFATTWIAACQASLSITNSRSSLRLTSIEPVMPTSHLILGRPLLLLPQIPPSIRVFSNESTLHMKWPEYWSFSFSIIPSKEQPGLISFRMDWLDLLVSKGLSRVFSNTTVQKHQFFCAQLSSQSNSHIHAWLLEKPYPWLDGPLLAK